MSTKRTSNHAISSFTHWQLKKGYNVIFSARRYAFKSYYLQPANDPVGDIIPIDIWTSLHWKSFEFISDEFISRPENIEKVGDLSVLHCSREVESYIKVFKGSTQNIKLKEKYYLEGKEFLENGTFERIFKENFSFLSESYYKKFEALYKSGDLKQLKSLLRKYLKLQMVARPFGTFVRKCKYTMGWFSQFRNSPGKFIAFIGPDGSGKSSLINDTIQRDTPFSGGHLQTWPFQDHTAFW